MLLLTFSWTKCVIHYIFMAALRQWWALGKVAHYSPPPITFLQKVKDLTI
jgi:hypothetical protein